MKISIRFKLISLFSLTVGSVVLLAVIFSYTHFITVLKGKDVAEFFDTELLEYSISIKDELVKISIPENLSLSKDKKFFNIGIAEEIIFDYGYVQIRNLPKSHNEKPKLLIKNKNLKNQGFSLNKIMLDTINSGSPYFSRITDQNGLSIPLVTAKIFDKNNKPFVLQIGASPEGVYKGVVILNMRVIMAGLILLAITTILGIFFVKKSFSPVRKMVALTKKITAEDLSHRIEFVKGKDEIAELAETLNSMIAGLERSFIKIKQFSNDVSHELKTPLTILKGEIEVALRKKRTTEDYEKILKSTLQESNKLAEIIENLFLLSQLEEQEQKPEFSNINLDEIALEIFEKEEKLAQKKGIKLSIENIDEIVIKGNSNLINQMIRNLVNNAINYTPKEGSVKISLTQKERPIFMVTDTGIGIEKSNQNKIFDRFYRVDSSRSSETGGTGLGLSIVKKIADLHQAQVSVESKPGTGSTFKIEFSS